MKNKRAESPRDFIPVAPSAVFDKFWEPGAKALGLELVPLFHNMVLSTENQTAHLIPQLIDELKRLREWFLKNLPDEEKECQADRASLLIKELELTSKETVIELYFG